MGDTIGAGRSPSSLGRTMLSLLTNTSAMTALQTLTTTQKALAKTQDQVSSGLRVGSAQDNAAYWSIGTTMKSQIGALSAVNDGLALTKSIADVTAVALVSIQKSLDKIKDDVITARQPGVSLLAMQSDISAQQQSIIDVVNSANFNGTNWLKQIKSSAYDSETDIDVDVSKADWLKISNGQEPNSSYSFNSSTKTTGSETVNGTNLTQVNTSGVHQTWTDANNGAASHVDTVTLPTSSGNFDLSTLGNATIATGYSTTQGLMTSSFSLAPTTMFADYTSGATSRQTTTFQGVVDPQNSYDYFSALPITHSYDGSGGDGILDSVIYISTNTRTYDNLGNNQVVVTPSNTGISPGGTIVTPASSSTFSSPATTVTQTSPVSLLNMNIVGSSDSDLDLVLKAVEKAMGGVINASASVGALQNKISTQMAFNSALSDAVTSGVGLLTDADMSVASTRLQALQTQQQLGIQSLSIANNNSSLIMKLFSS